MKGEGDIIEKAVGWQGLPNKEFPLIFHGVQGLDERESNSPRSVCMCTSLLYGDKETNHLHQLVQIKYEVEQCLIIADFILVLCCNKK